MANNEEKIAELERQADEERKLARIYEKRAEDIERKILVMNFKDPLKRYRNAGQEIEVRFGGHCYPMTFEEIKQCCDEILKEAQSE